MTLPLRIVYTDETAEEGTVADWAALRADGVDTIEVAGHVFSGHAIYWLYFDKECEGGTWVLGMGSTYASPPPPETLFRPAGKPVTTRNIVTMPDLRHQQVKLGWWKRPSPGQNYTPGVVRA